MSSKFVDATILLADDEPDLLELYSEILQGIPGAIDTATDGAQALRLIESKRYDCIVSDIAMPKMSGLELLESARQLKKTVPFVIVTAYWDKSNAIRALRAGAFDFVEKPVKSESLKAIVSSAIEVGIGLRAIESNVLEIFKGFEQLSEGCESKVLQHQSMAYRPRLGKPNQ